MYLLIGDERALLIDTGFGVSRLDEALNWVYDQVPFIFRHLMYQEIKHAKNTPTVPVKPFPEEGYFELGNRKVTFFDTPGHTPGSYLHPTILPSSFPPTIKSAHRHYGDGRCSILALKTSFFRNPATHAIYYL